MSGFELELENVFQEKVHGTLIESFALAIQSESKDGGPTDMDHWLPMETKPIQFQTMR